MFALSSLSIVVASAVTPAGRHIAQPRAREVTAPRSAAIAIAGAHSIRVKAGAGYLHIEGRPGLTQVRAHGTARAASDAVLRDIQLVARRSGDAVEIETVFPENDEALWNQEAALDVTVEVPSELPLDVTDGSGETVVHNVGAMRLTDGSGDIDIAGAGALTIHDGSGDLTASHVTGDVSISDGSGDIHVTDVHGSVRIPSDGSGGITVADVTGSVNIDSDGSGSVDVQRVGGDFTLDSKGSGDVEYKDVRGRVTIPERKRHD